jgi:hypothetical protein
MVFAFACFESSKLIQIEVKIVFQTILSWRKFMSSNLPVLKSILFQIMLSYLIRLYTNLKLVL